MTGRSHLDAVPEIGEPGVAEDPAPSSEHRLAPPMSAAGIRHGPSTSVKKVDKGKGRGTAEATLSANAKLKPSLPAAQHHQQQPKDAQVHQHLPRPFAVPQSQPQPRLQPRPQSQVQSQAQAQVQQPQSVKDVEESPDAKPLAKMEGCCNCRMDGDMEARGEKCPGLPAADSDETSCQKCIDKRASCCEQCKIVAIAS